MSTKEANHKRLLIGIVAVVVAVAILFIPMIPTVEAYTVTEPYDRLATYQVTSATLTEEFELFGKGIYHRSSIVVKNTDKFGGAFTVTHYVYDVNGLLATKTTSDYMAAGGTKTFIADFDTKWLQDIRGEYSVAAPNVVDQKVVAKQKTVYKSTLEILLQVIE